MASTIEMRQERARVFEQIKALVDLGKSEKRELSSDEQMALAKMNADIDELGVQIQNQENDERVKAIEASLAASTGHREVKPGSRTPNEEFLDQARAVMRGESRAFEAKWDVESLPKRGNEERALLTTGTGANAIPVSFVRSLREYLIDNSGVRQTNVTVLNTESGEALRVPRATAHPTAAIIGEGAPKTESLPTFSQVTLGAYKYANSQQLSEEFVDDQVVNVLDYLARQNGVALGNAAGAHYVNGNGTTQPEGVLAAMVALGGAQVITGAAASGNVTAITADELVRIPYAVKAGYRARGFWLMNDASIAKVRAIREGTGATAGNFLWAPGMQQGAPDVLLGYPIVTDPNMPTMAASANSILFGDFSGFYVRDVNGIRFERSNEYAFINDLVTFRSVFRTDSKLIDPTGLVVWKNAAT